MSRRASSETGAVRTVGRGERELAVCEWLSDRGWVAVRTSASVGVNVVALCAGRRPRLIAVRVTADGPFASFGPRLRARLVDAARDADAELLLAWWPAGAELHWVLAEDWPVMRGRRPRSEGPR